MSTADFYVNYTQSRHFGGGGKIVCVMYYFPMSISPPKLKPIPSSDPEI